MYHSIIGKFDCYYTLETKTLFIMILSNILQFFTLISQIFITFIKLKKTYKQTIIIILYMFKFINMIFILNFQSNSLMVYQSLSTHCQCSYILQIYILYYQTLYPTITFPFILLFYSFLDIPHIMNISYSMGTPISHFLLLFFNIMWILIYYHFSRKLKKQKIQQIKEEIQMNQNKSKQSLLFPKQQSKEVSISFSNRQLKLEQAKDLFFEYLQFPYFQILNFRPWMKNKNILLLSENFGIQINNCDFFDFVKIDYEDAWTSESNLVEWFLTSTFELFQNSQYEYLAKIFQETEFAKKYINERVLDMDSLRKEINFKKLCLNSLVSNDSMQQELIFYNLDNTYMSLNDVKIFLIVISLNNSPYFLFIFEKNINYIRKFSQSCRTQKSDTFLSKQDTLQTTLLTNIFSSVSHEFGTYLNCIISLSTSYQDLNKLDLLDYMQSIQTNAYFLNFILQNIRDFNHILLQSFCLKIEQVNLFEEIYQLKSNLQINIQSRNNTLEIEPDLPQLLSVYNDSDRIRQVLFQLLSNAIRFTQNGAITIVVSPQDNAAYIKITVKDQGIGMSEDEQSRLRELLERKQKLSKISKNSVGCSLGLTIANLIAIQLSGSSAEGIKFKSKEEVGSEFSFLISNNKKIQGNSEQSLLYLLNDNYLIDSKYQRSLKENSLMGQKTIHQRLQQDKFIKIGTIQTVKQEKTSFLNLEQGIELFEDDYMAIEVPKFGDLKLKKSVLQYDLKSECCSRVLIIDDEYFNMKSLTVLLRKYTDKIDFAFNGKEAIEKVQQKEECKNCRNQSYIVYFIDINMPVMDGYETVRNLKRMMNNNEIQKGICAAVSGFVDLETRKRCMLEGMDYYISKPVKLKILEEFIKQYFQI